MRKIKLLFVRVHKAPNAMIWLNSSVWCCMRLSHRIEVSMKKRRMCALSDPKSIYALDGSQKHLYYLITTQMLSQEKVSTPQSDTSHIHRCIIHCGLRCSNEYIILRSTCADTHRPTDSNSVAGQGASA